jgi:hypothetical protein
VVANTPKSVTFLSRTHAEPATQNILVRRLSEELRDYRGDLSNSHVRRAYRLPALAFSWWMSARHEFRVNPHLHGSARWVDARDIKAAGLLNNDGVYVGAWRDKAGK